MSYFINQTIGVEVLVNGVDISEIVTEITLSDSSGIKNGLIATDGEMKLGSRAGAVLPGNYKREYFSRGMVVRIYLNYPSGERKLHPRGYLYVLDNGWNPESEEITVQLGCPMAMHALTEDVDVLYELVDLYVPLTRRNYAGISAALATRAKIAWYDNFGQLKIENLWSGETETSSPPGQWVSVFGVTAGAVAPLSSDVQYTEEQGDPLYDGNPNGPKKPKGDDDNLNGTPFTGDTTPDDVTVDFEYGDCLYDNDTGQAEDCGQSPEPPEYPDPCVTNPLSGLCEDENGDPFPLNEECPYEIGPDGRPINPTTGLPWERLPINCEAIDPDTGLPVDPLTGLPEFPFDPEGDPEEIPDALDPSSPDYDPCKEGGIGGEPLRDKECPEGQICSPTSGYCTSDLCDGVECPVEGEWCGKDGKCTGDPEDPNNPEGPQCENEGWIYNPTGGEDGEGGCEDPNAPDPNDPSRPKTLEITESTSNYTTQYPCISYERIPDDELEDEDEEEEDPEAPPEEEEEDDPENPDEEDPTGPGDGVPDDDPGLPEGRPSECIDEPLEPQNPAAGDPEPDDGDGDGPGGGDGDGQTSCMSNYRTVRSPLMVGVTTKSKQVTTYNGPGNARDTSTTELTGPALQANSQYIGDLYQLCRQSWATQCNPNGFCPTDAGVEQVTLSKSETIVTFNADGSVATETTDTFEPKIRALQADSWRAGVENGEIQGFQEIGDAYSLYRSSRTEIVYEYPKQGTKRTTTRYQSITSWGAANPSLSQLDALNGLKIVTVDRSRNNGVNPPFPDSMGDPEPETGDDDDPLPFPGEDPLEDPLEPFPEPPPEPCAEVECTLDKQCYDEIYDGPGPREEYGAKQGECICLPYYEPNGQGGCIDPGTGFLIDPDTGYPIEPNCPGPNGEPGRGSYDPDTGDCLEYDPETGLPVDPDTGLPLFPVDPIAPDVPDPCEDVVCTLDKKCYDEVFDGPGPRLDEGAYSGQCICWDYYESDGQGGCIDPISGYPVDPETGYPVYPDCPGPDGTPGFGSADPDTGECLDYDDETGLPIDPDLGEPIFPTDPDLLNENDPTIVVLKALPYRESIPAPILLPVGSNLTINGVIRDYEAYIIRCLRAKGLGLRVGESMREEISDFWKPNVPFRYADPRYGIILACRGDAHTWNITPTGCFFTVDGLTTGFTNGTLYVPDNVVGVTTPVLNS